MQFSPSAILKPYVKSYFIVTVDADTVNQVFYPSGYVDFAVNISSGNVITIINGRSIDMPKVEVLGHLTSPTRLTVARGTSILIARIYPHASSLFFPNPISDFTNHSIDLCDVIGQQSIDFHDRLINAYSIEQKIEAMDQFLTEQLIRNEKNIKRTKLIQQVCNDLSIMNNSFDIGALSARYGVSERYIQKLFNNVVGLSPKSFFSVQRFNKSLQQVISTEDDLTSIAYECGYYDQAHFIREFRKFTGITPSEARPKLIVTGGSN